MFKDIKNFKFIGCALVVLYACSAVVYGKPPDDVDFRSYSFILSLLFVGLFVGSCAAIALKEWGRRLLVSLNIVMAFCLTFLCFKFPQYVPIVYPVLCVIVVAVFSMDRIKFQIKKDWINMRKSILVVDDDEGFQRTIKRILLPKGYSVLTATTGERGLQIAKKQKPDLIILDVILPGIKGRDLCGMLKNDPETRDIPVVFLTAKDSPDDIDAEIAIGAVAHLTKPVNGTLLIAELKKIIS